jgi:Na+/melibiose symporter-like transporter
VFFAGFVLTVAAFPEQASPDEVSRASELSLIAHYVPVSVGLWVLGVMFLLLYNIDEAKHRANVKRVAELVAEKRARELQDAGLTPTTL